MPLDLFEHPNELVPEGGERVSSFQRLTAVSVGYGHTCAITAEGHAYCWGANQTGQLGVGSFAQRTTPSLVSAP
jgi:alpha-tubulin suppressor-like RCC1 family protein